jgi:trypsin-like peptidase
MDVEKRKSGEGAMRRCLLSALVLVGVSSGGEAACVDPSTLVRSTVSITREFGEDERRAAPAVLGIRGTGWFLSPRLVVTAGHVADAMRLSIEDWKEIEVRERESKAAIPARILRIAGSAAEKIAVLELRGRLADAVALQMRKEPLVPEERLLSLAYPKGQLQFASGRFAEYGSRGSLAGMALLEMHDGSNRLVLDHGASGAPVLDCEGRVVAVVSTLITQTISLPTGAVRVSTAWQTPNVLSIPIGVLQDHSSLE